METKESVEKKQVREPRTGKKRRRYRFEEKLKAVRLHLQEGFSRELVCVETGVGLTTLTAYAAPVVSESGEHPVISAIDARHNHVYLQVVSGNGSSLIRPRVAPIEEALGASQFGAPHLVGNAAKILADRWPADALPPFKVDAQPAPDIAWVAWLGAAVSPDTAPARPFYLRAPDAKLPKDLLQKASQPTAS